MTGSFQNVTVPHGYHKILDIPAGATFINVTERRASPNYLGETFCSGTSSSILEANVPLFVCCFYRENIPLSLSMDLKIL